MKTVMAAFLVAAAMMTSLAQAVDGNELYKWGRAWREAGTQDSPYAGPYVGYIQGFIDLHTDLSDSEIGIIETQFFCMPASAQLDQAFDAVMRYLEAHPEKRKFTGSSLVAAALWKAFPCD